MTYGIDGVHYNKGEDKTFTRKESQVKDWQTDIQPLSALIAIDKAYLKTLEIRFGRRTRS